MREAPTVHVVDLHYLGVPKTIGCYVVVGSEGPVLIEAGPGSTFERLRSGVQELGFSLSDIQDVLLTHIHLDHAGAAGRLAAEGARIHVHEAGAPHLRDPSKLIESARRIYGDQMDRLWGEMLPVPGDRLVSIRDDEAIRFGDLKFRSIYTPGHAKHHCSFALEMPRRPVCFTGDAAGMIVPTPHNSPTSAGHLPFINLPTPPPEFDLELWQDSVKRLEAPRFGALYLTHFGEVRTPVSHLLAVRRALRSHAEFVRSSLRAGFDESTMVDRYREWVTRQGQAAGMDAEQIPRFLSDNLLRMNVVGMTRYWTKVAAGRGT